MKNLLLLPILLSACAPPKPTRIKAPVFCYYYHRLKKCDAGRNLDLATEQLINQKINGKRKKVW